MSRPKPVNNPLSCFRKATHAVFSAIDRLKTKNLRTRSTRRLKKLSIMLVLMVIVMVASCQASQVRPSELQIGPVKKIFDLVVEPAKTKTLILRLLVSIPL